MTDNLINTKIVPLLLVVLLSFSWVIQLFWHWFFFWRLARHKTKPAASDPVPVSIVICAHNEYLHLKENLQLVLEQDYPEFEVLVVNHSSDDDTRYLLSYYCEKYPNIKSITIQEDLNFFTGKKFPLSIGIKSARYEWVLLTDANCRPAGREWIRTMQSAFRPKTEIVLGYSPFVRRKGLLNLMIRFDAAYNAIQYLSFALAGIPFKGIGRNLSYRKQLFFDNNGFISHYRLYTGDDDLFINQVATGKNTAVVTEPAAFTFATPRESFSEWILQKKNHLFTSFHYKKAHRFLIILYNLSYFLFLGTFVVMLALNWSVIPVLVIFLLRLISQMIVFSGSLKRLNEKDLIPLVVLFEMFMFFNNLFVFMSGFTRSARRWK